MAPWAALLSRRRPPPEAARRRAGLAAAAVVAAGLLVPSQSAGQASEYGVKAAYLIKFAPFVVWPAGTLSNPDAPLVVCVGGKDPFGGALDTIARAQGASGRRVEVRRMAKVSPRAGCHVLYVAPGPTADEALAAAGSGVLTVTDTANPAGRRGVVNFVVRDKRVRFEIDEGAAQKQGLSLSSKLLSLAVSVRNKRSGA